jgi:Chromate transporter
MRTQWVAGNMTDFCVDGTTPLSEPGMPQDEPFAPVRRPAFREALRFWFKPGWISFGGTAAHIAIMHDDLAEKKRWISNASFLYALSHCSCRDQRRNKSPSIYRVEAARQVGRSCCRNTLRVAFHLRGVGAERDLCPVGQPAVDRGDVQRTQARRHCSSDDRPP